MFLFFPPQNLGDKCCDKNNKHLWTSRRTEVRIRWVFDPARVPPPAPFALCLASLPLEFKRNRESDRERSINPHRLWELETTPSTYVCLKSLDGKESINGAKSLGSQSLVDPWHSTFWATFTLSFHRKMWCSRPSCLTAYLSYLE